MLFPFPLELFAFPFPLVAQNYSHSYGNPMGIPREWEFPQNSHSHAYLYSMAANVTATVRAAHWQIGSVRHSQSRHSLMIVICALEVSKLDCCNAVLVSVSKRCGDNCS